MIKLTFRWAVGSVVRAVFRQRSISIVGEAGVPFRFRPSEYPTLLRGPVRVDRGLRKLWAALLRPDDVIFDIGANIGTTVQRFHALLQGRCSVWAFEPMPRNLDLLQTNVDALGNDQVHIVPCALGDHDGPVTFCDNLRHGALSRNAATLDHANPRWPLYWNRYNEIEVPMKTLDGFVRDHPEAQPAFIKIDVEGAALGVLNGGRDTINRCRPIVHCEYHSEEEQKGATHFLGELGYRAIVRGDDGRLVWCDPKNGSGHFVHPQTARSVEIVAT